MVSNALRQFYDITFRPEHDERIENSDRQILEVVFLTIFLPLCSTELKIYEIQHFLAVSAMLLSLRHYEVQFVQPIFFIAH